MREMFDSYDKIVKNLIIQVRKENQEAFEEMLQIYDPLITSFVNCFCRTDVADQDAEDIKQELTVAFYNSILSYDLGQTDVSFGLYAKICLNNALITQIRAMRKRKGAEMVSLESEDWLTEESEDFEDPSAALIKREEMRELNRRIEQALSPFENKVWRSYVAGCTSREIARSLGKSEKSIDNAIFRVRQKLKLLFAGAQA